MAVWILILISASPSLLPAQAQTIPSAFEKKCSEVLAEKVIRQGTTIAPDRRTREELCQGFQNFQQSDFLAAALDKDNGKFRTAVLNAKELKQRFQAEVALLSLKTTDVVLAASLGSAIQTQAQADQFVAMVKYGVPAYEARMILRKTPICENIKLSLQTVRDQLYPLAQTGPEGQKKILRGVLATLNDLMAPPVKESTASEAKPVN